MRQLSDIISEVETLAERMKYYDEKQTPEQLVEFLQTLAKDLTEVDQNVVPLADYFDLEREKVEAQDEAAEMNESLNRLEDNFNTLTASVKTLLSELNSFGRGETRETLGDLGLKPYIDRLEQCFTRRIN